MTHTFPNRIRELRKQARLTLDDVAKRLDPPVTLATIQKLETGGMTLNQRYIYQIANIFGVSPGELIEFRDPDSNPATPQTEDITLSISIRNGGKVTISGLPSDLTTAEALRISKMIQALAV